MAIKDLIGRLEEGGQPQGLSVRVITAVQVTADEIRQALAAHPDHPLAWVFSGAVEGLPGNTKLYPDRNDLLGLATNRELLTRRVQVDDEWHEVKELGDSLDRPAAGGDQTTSPPDDTPHVEPPTETEEPEPPDEPTPDEPPTEEQEPTTAEDAGGTEGEDYQDHLSLPEP